MIAQLTQDDIDNGIKCSYTECPIALCLKRYFKEVRVENFEVIVDGRRFFMAHELQVFAVNFDDGLPVKPTEISIAELGQYRKPYNMQMRSR